VRQSRVEFRDDLDAAGAELIAAKCPRGLDGLSDVHELSFRRMLAGETQKTLHNFGAALRLADDAVEESLLVRISRGLVQQL